MRPSKMGNSITRISAFKLSLGLFDIRLQVLNQIRSEPRTLSLKGEYAIV